MSTLHQNMKEEFALWALKQNLNIFDLDFWLKCHSSNADFLTQSTHHVQSFCKIWKPSVKKQNSSHCDLHTNFSIFYIDHKVILVIWNLPYNLCAINNHWTKYEHPPSKTKREIWDLRSKTDFKYIWSQVISVLRCLCCNLHTCNHSAKYKHPPSKMTEKFALWDTTLDTWVIAVM